MKRAVVFFALLMLFGGCGNGRSGGPDDPAANGTAGQEQVYIGNREVAAEPYFRQNGTGSGSITLTLRKGVNLIGLRYDHHEDDYQAEATATLATEEENFFFVVAREHEGGETYLKTVATAEEVSCHVVVETADTKRDKWELMAFHKNDLGEIKNEIKDPAEVYEEPGEDPLYPYQWHLKNSGQSDYVIFDAVEGEDINVEPVWDRNIFGSGVTVAVVDEGIEINHPDLAGNIDIRHCWNYTTLSYDTTPTDPNNAHGTAVAGIIAASANNGIGGRGVAPKTTLVSYNMLESQGIVNWSLALESLVRGLDTVDIYNNSWGRRAGALHANPGTTLSPYYQVANQMSFGVKHGRSGRGAIYVKSAGNDRLGLVDDIWEPFWNANFDPEQVDRYVIVVGASDADGTYSWYSNPGANLLLNAPGGDTQEAYLKADGHSIVTTDLGGKHAGYDYQDTNLIDYHFNAEGNENYDYTDRMNGTSAAGPVVSGVVALMLEANPELTWRDVRYILATTATKNDPACASWFQNGAGRWFSNDYGFGRVNAERAVEAAQSWTFLGVEEKTSAKGNAAISHNDAGDKNLSKTGTIHLKIEDNMTIEYVNVQFSLDDNETGVPGPLPDASMIEVNLTSPAGTVSTLIAAPNGLPGDAAFVNTRVGSNAFVDERSQGAWSLSVREVDAAQAPFKDPKDLRAFKVDNILLEIYGRE